MSGYGRENEMEADRLGMKYMVKAGYDPESIGNVFTMFQAARNSSASAPRPKAASRGSITACSPAIRVPIDRAVQAAKGAANIKDAPPRAGSSATTNTCTTINGIAYGSSKAQGVVRDNRFYHADMGITLAFPRGWTIENQRDRLLAFTPKKDAIMQITGRRQAREASAARIPAHQAEGRSRCSRASR